MVTDPKHPKLQTNKVGALPWRVNKQSGEIEFLIHLPWPKRDPNNPNKAENGKPYKEEAKIMQWGMMRGTVQRKNKTGDEKKDDIRNKADLETLKPEEIEDPLETLRREAKQELGISRMMIKAESIKDWGFHPYESKTDGKGSYLVHVYSFQLADEKVSLSLMERAAKKESQQLGWYSLPSIRHMAENGTFKPGYVPIAEAVEASIKSHENWNRKVEAGKDATRQR